MLLLCATGVQADWRTLGDVTSVRTLPNGVDLRAGESRIEISILSPVVARLRYAPNGNFPPEDSVAVLKGAFSPPTVQILDHADSVSINTGAFQVRILKSPLSVAFLDPGGEVILQDHPAYPVAFQGSAFRVWKAMPLDEHYFGLGDKAGPIDHRDQAFTMWNTDAFGWTQGTDPLYKSIPFFMGVRNGRAYGIFLDNTYRSSFDFGKESRDAYSFGAEGGPLDYYFFYGPSPAAVLTSYTALVGRTPLPPKFALGYQQSRYSYYPEATVRQIAQQFRSRRIPCDVIYLDIDYEDGHRSFTIDRSRFPNFEGMVRDLSQQGFKLIPIVDLHIKQQPGYKPYDQAVQHDYLVRNQDGSVYIGKVWPGDSVFPDFTRSEVRQWFGGLYADFLHMGIRGFWNDMNEPAVFRYPEKTMPLDTVHSVEGRKTDHREVHNIYGMENVHATYDGMLRFNPNVRPYVLTRAAFAGTQRYAATWTGDNAATWVHYRLSITDLLSMGLSGYPLAGVDEGGFDGDPTPELLTRWTELGAFLPLFRNHSGNRSRNREPWVDGPEHEAIRRRFIETRYRLLPYIYTSMDETSRTGLPLMRPMFIQFPDDPALAIEDKEFMFGPDLLIAPKIDETVGPYEIKLPAGVWFDYWTGTRVQAQTLQVNPAIDELPVYVRGGAILPQQPMVQDADQIPEGPLDLSVYPASDCRGSIYADDGSTLDYRRGEFFRQHFSCEAAGDSLRIHFSPPEGNYSPWWKMIRLTAFNATHAPNTVSASGVVIAHWHFDPEHHSVTFEIPAASTAQDITLRY